MKVALVTGASKGIGKACALRLAKDGYTVVVNYSSSDAAAEETLSQIQAAGSEGMIYKADVSKLDQVKLMIREVIKAYGRIDVLVNNAANVALKDGRVDELTIEMWDGIFQSDLRGTFYTTKCVLPYLQKNENGGSIINIGSMASCAGDLGSTAYACAKAGVDMLTKSTALQYGKQNIRCNCVRPGLIVTPENEAHVPQALKDIFLSNIMVDRYGCPADIGHMCVYLASDESTYVTGQIVNVDGGLNSHVPTVAQFKELNSRTW